jgi:hypothetical protein
MLWCSSSVTVAAHWDDAGFIKSLLSVSGQSMRLSKQLTLTPCYNLLL